MLNVPCGEIHSWVTHPWTGGGPHESRVVDLISESALYVSLSVVFQMKIHIIFVLNFLYSFSLLFFFFPPSMDWVYPTHGIFIWR